MSYVSSKLLWSFASVSLAVLAGCGVPASSNTPAASAPAANAAAHATAAANDPEMEKSLAELSPEDQALARKQKICPVSGEPLGSMGKPHQITVKGRTVFLCCSGCEGEIQSDPDKYLAKIDAAKP